MAPEFENSNRCLDVVLRPPDSRVSASALSDVLLEESPSGKSLDLANYQVYRFQVRTKLSIKRPFQRIHTRLDDATYISDA